MKNNATLNIRVPEELLTALNKIEDRSRFIRKALWEKVRRRQKIEHLRKGVKK